MLKRWVDSLNYAIEGVLHAAQNQRHIKFQLLITGIVLLTCFVLGIKKNEFILISIIASIVLIVEMLNSAIEQTVDLLSPEIQEKARIAKDISAGAVLISAIMSLIAGYIILTPYLKKTIDQGIHIVKKSGTNIAIIALIIVLILVIIIKAYVGKGHPLRGGLPSGHTALAFSIWVSVTYTSASKLVSALTLIIAMILAQSRVLLKIHTYLEVLMGSLLGSIITFLLFKIFN